MSSPPTPSLPHAQYERFESMREYEAMFDALIPSTQRVVRLFDKSLSARFNAPARCDLLRTFLRTDPSNRLYVVLHEPEALPRVCPRFVTLLTQYGHLVSVRQTPRYARHVSDPFTVFDASHYLHRFHVDHMRFARGRDELTGAQQLLDRFQELWDASKPASTTTVLGL